MTTKVTDAFKRRDKLVIMAEIMNISRNGALKTQIMYKANLSFAQLNDYLKVLAETKLLENTANNGKQIYKATQKGKDFLNRHNQVMDMLNEETENRVHIRVPPEILLRKM
jgi:predicted transcriptional regulator